MRASASLIRRLLTVVLTLLLLLAAVLLLALSSGSGGEGLLRSLSVVLGQGTPDTAMETIVWRIRLPRAFLAALAGGALSLGGLVFQALLRNPLAEPYILGVSGGSAIGAIIGILLGLTRFPGVSACAFLGSLATLALIVAMSAGRSVLRKDALLLSGVMVNAFCAAVIMFLVSMTQDARLHNIIFWLMGDLSSADGHTAVILAAVLIPCFGLVFLFSHALNLLLMGNDMAQSMGIALRSVTVLLLVVTSLMVSAVVSFSGLIGFVGLVIPHLLRFLLGPDHRILVPACILGGGAYLTACDILARVLPDQGEMPAGVITALIGAPLFIFLLRKTRR